MKKVVQYLIVIAFLAGGSLLSGCSSSPSEEELKQLDDLKASVKALQMKVADKKAEKANLEKQIAEKNGKLQQCQSDQEAVKKGLGK